MDLDDLLVHDIANESFLDAIPSLPLLEVTKLMACNLPPSGAVRSTILAKIQQYEHFILLVNGSGHRLNAKHQSSIILERTKAEKLLVKLRSIIHPIRSVPDDVLLEIFATIVDFTAASSVSTDTELWACSRVCQRWRALVIDTPSLWSDVRLNFDDDIYLTYHRSRAERILAERLERSGSHLLDVFVRGSRAQRNTSRIISCLLTSAARWRTLTVNAGPEVYEMFEKCPEDSLTELRTLSIMDSVYMDADMGEEDRYLSVVFDAFDFTPKLHRLFMSPLPLTSFSLSAETMYNNIQEFSINLFDQLIDVLRLLPAMRVLKSLDILCDAEWDEYDSIDMVRLPLLSRITLRDYNDMRLIPDTWTRLYLPNVSSLQLAYEGLVLHPTFPLFDKHNPRITDFACYINTFTDVKIPDFERDLIVMLQSLPNITNLRLSSCCTTPMLLDAMRSDTRFLPALMDVTLIWNIPSYLPDDDIFLLIDTLHTRARSANCANVKYLALESEIILYERPTPYTTMWEELQIGGLEVVQTYEPLF